MSTFPKWKTILLVVVLILGVIYSLPNIYPQYPTIQVAGTEGVVADAAVLDQLKAVLKEKQLPSRSAELDETNLITIRFNETETSLKAKEIIKATLDSRFTVVINSKAQIPAWLEMLGAKPMSLGLDLRGGVHFLLQVDVESVAKKRLGGDSRNMTDDLRNAKIRYAGIATREDTTVILSFNDADAREAAQAILKRQYPEYSFEKSELAGRYVLTGAMTPDALHKIHQYALEQTMTVLRNRVNELGISEPIVTQQGRNRIVVDLPGIQDAAQAEQVLGGTATIEFRLVDEENDVRQAVAGQVPFGSRLYFMKEGNYPVLLKNQVILSGSSIVSATSTFDQYGKPAVNIRIAGSGVSYFSRVSRANVGKNMATVFIESKTDSKLVNGEVQYQQRKVEKVISVAVIRQGLGASFQISGLSSMVESRNLALLLRAGALPANIYPVEQSIVGPSLGKENIAKGLRSVEIGSLAIILFMLIYYRLFGFVADLALVTNLFLLLAILSLLGATLTLPGIAGIVLTVGMAVDANVLINERIREELRNGISPRVAINEGYDKAFATIVDANVTTFIVVLVLFAVGSGSVKGFAVTVMIGLLTSMFTAITGTRAVVHWLYTRKPHIERLSIGI